MSLSSPLVKLIAGYLFHLNSPDIIEELNDEKITTNKVLYCLSNNIYLSDGLEKYVRENAYNILTNLSLIYHPEDKKLLQKLNCPGSIDQWVIDRIHERKLIEFNLVDIIIIWTVINRNNLFVLRFLEDFISCFNIITIDYARTLRSGTRMKYTQYNFAACKDIVEYFLLMDDVDAYRYIVDRFKISSVHSYIWSVVVHRRDLPNVQRYLAELSMV
jgi:hypothetical protein